MPDRSRNAADGFCGWRLLALLTATAVANGCGPSAVKVPPIKPKRAAEAAIAKYDTSGDGELSGDEIMACPSLVDAMNNIDSDHNRSLSEQELEDRFKMWVEGGVGVAFLT